MSRTVLRSVCLIVAMCLAAQGLSAQAAAQPVKDAPDRQKLHVSVSLLSELQALVPGERNWLGLWFKIDPGWHIYWDGVNDTGFPPKFEIKAPKGFTVGEAVWPAPKRLLAPGNELDFIYEGSVLILVLVEVPKDATGDAAFSADCNWLVCSSLCLPEASKAALNVPVLTAGEKPKLSLDAPKFEQARTRFPKPLTPDSGIAAQITGKSLVIESARASKLSFFPAAGCVPMPKLAKEGEAKGQKLTITLEPEPAAAGRVKGIIEITNKEAKEPAFFSVDLEFPQSGTPTPGDPKNK